MTDSKEMKRITKAMGKMRFVTRTKWELPIRGSKPYWDKIYEGIESKVIRVRKSSTTSPSSIPYPALSPSILYSASSASCDDINVYDFAEHRPATENVDAPAAEPIVKVYPPSPRGLDCAEQGGVKFQSNLVESESNNPAKSVDSPWRLTKLSKITKLVNEFLSSTRNRVRPISASSKRLGSSSRRRSLIPSSGKAPLMREQSFEHQSMQDDAYQHESPIASMTQQESKEKVRKLSSGRGAINSERKVVGFRDDIAVMDKKKFDPGEVVPSSRMGRARAPSLSVASALPSFGKVVISIEDIDSAGSTDEAEKIKEETDLQDRSKFLPNDTRHSKADDQKLSHDFLKVPEVRATGHASYPLHASAKFQRQVATKNVAAQLKKTKLMLESQRLRKNQGFWPRKSLVNVFRALKAMKRGVQSKARIESETNRFFAAPLEIYSPSARSSISSDDRTDFIDVQDESEHNERTEDEYGEADESDENVGKESESSYASVRERLMRNAGAHVGKEDIQPGRATYEENALGATSAREDSSSFYDTSTGDELEVKPRRNRKTITSDIIAIPKVASVFPRIKADKCLACMCQSLKDIDQQREAGRFLKNYTDAVSLDEEPLDICGVQSLNEVLFEQSYRHLTTNVEVTKSSGPEEPDEESAVAMHPASAPDSTTVGTLSRSASQAEESHRPRTVGRTLSKNVINAKSLISSLSLVSERSKSASDQDDSDQGCVEASGNEIGLTAGSTSKYLAPCHMPINLKPSLEPLKALRQKKSRSIRSRVASAEKSADSANEDDDDSDEDVANKRLPVDAGKMKPAEAPGKLSLLNNSEGESAITADMGKDLMESIIDDRNEKTLSTISGAEDFSEYEQIISDREVVKISIKCLQENKNPTEILQTLAREYSKRLSYKAIRSPRAPNVRKNEKIAKNLVALLVDSKSYLNRGKWPNDNFDLFFSSKQPPLCNSRQLRRILPLKSYNLVAPILGMAEWYPRRKSTNREPTKRTHRFVSHTEDSPRKEFSDSAYDLMVHPPSRIGQVSFEKTWKDKRPKLSPYSLFLRKPRRKAVTWRPLTERDLEGYDPEATLKMRATKITDRICEDFCRWLESLAAGTNQSSGIDVDVLKDMFETDFTAEVCRTMQLSINEMPMVPSAVALARNCPGAAELALTRKHLVKDAKAEKKPKRTIGFGTALPDHMKFQPPRNRVDEKWLQCKNVPKDLETMDAVWKGITHLSSVKGFIDWLKAHPEVSRPKALENVLTSRETLLTRQSQEVMGLELELDQIQNLKVGDNDPDAY